MNRYMRILMFTFVAAQAVFGFGFLLQIDFFVQIWPLPDTTPLTFIFLSSIFFAAVASQLYCLLSHEYAGLAGIGLDYAVILTPMAVLFAQLSLWAGALISLMGGLFGVALFVWSVRLPFRDTRRTPRLVLISFAIFVIALILLGGALVTGRTNILPWRMTTEMTMVAGWMFLGAAAYFIYALIRPVWGNAAGQLAGFLAYDVVLIIPFLQRLPIVAPELQTNLIVYILVVVYSGALAIYYLFINPNTRLVRTTAASTVTA